MSRGRNAFELYLNLLQNVTVSQLLPYCLHNVPFCNKFTRSCELVCIMFVSSSYTNEQLFAKRVHTLVLVTTTTVFWLALSCNIQNNLLTSRQGRAFILKRGKFRSLQVVNLTT